MPLRRQYMRDESRLYAPMVEFGTVRYRNPDGTLEECEELRWRMQWQPLEEAAESTGNVTVITRRCNWRLFRRNQKRPPSVGDQIVARNGDVWEIVGPVSHKMRESIFLCPCVQAVMAGKNKAD